MAPAAAPMVVGLERTAYAAVASEQAAAARQGKTQTTTRLVSVAVEAVVAVPEAEAAFVVVVEEEAAVAQTKDGAAATGPVPLRHNRRPGGDGRGGGSRRAWASLTIAAVATTKAECAYASAPCAPPHMSRGFEWLMRLVMPPVSRSVSPPPSRTANRLLSHLIMRSFRLPWMKMDRHWCLRIWTSVCAYPAPAP